ncbi:thiol-disulfide oxidoreductase DCC family protein [Neptuniibacter caesariensis]|uniref:Thiol-disulfide oxidoreductase n=1 Tax=Neptuniibacter caesariensis TaxID=207954 RepID=A0A7U8GTI5_NEPCE|nr:thiol-disulfide oxidoreductase DCC family protein [Neptuniibacter caesariensis]EAR62471.1 hypothetical protein MED92_15578 [Oceanospirillum sp. MED92] [Neptuniibacter caesariensis]
MSQLPPNLNSTDKVILFDGACKLCNGWANFIIKHDKARQFKLCSVQSEQGKVILEHFGYPRSFYETMLYVEGGQCFEKSEAFLNIVLQLGYPWKTLNLFRVLPSAIRNWLYDRIALNRYKLFGKYDYCQLPSPDYQGRFLDDN